MEKPVTVLDMDNQSSPLLDAGTHELAGTNLELIYTAGTPDTIIVDQTRSSSVLESEIPTQTSDYGEGDSSAYFVHALLHAILLILFCVFPDTSSDLDTTDSSDSDFDSSSNEGIVRLLVATLHVGMT